MNTVCLFVCVCFSFASFFCILVAQHAAVEEAVTADYYAALSPQAQCPRCPPKHSLRPVDTPPHPPTPRPSHAFHCRIAHHPHHTTPSPHTAPQAHPPLPAALTCRSWSSGSVHSPFAPDPTPPIHLPSFSFFSCFSSFLRVSSISRVLDPDHITRPFRPLPPFSFSHSHTLNLSLSLYLFSSSTRPPR